MGEEKDMVNHPGHYGGETNVYEEYKDYDGAIIIREKVVDEVK